MVGKMTLDDLRRVIMRIGKHAGENEVEIVEDTETEFRVRIYTDNNSYAIVGNYKDNGGDYLGCMASSRKPRAGEDWTRGSDLADGSLEWSTWVRIISDIVAYELVKVVKQPTHTETVSINDRSTLYPTGPSVSPIRPCAPPPEPEGRV